MLQEAVSFLRTRTSLAPPVGVILGSGLGAFAEELTGSIQVPDVDVPHLAHSTAVGHAGQFVFGHLDGFPIAVMAGRVHLYEGYTAEEITFGVRILHAIGVRSLLITNAAGGIHPDMQPGDLVLISDHLNLQGVNPLVGLRAGFPDMTEAYDHGYRDCARGAALGLGITLREGVYAGLLGPSYETPAEIRYLARIGADLVGMSTVAEVIVARSLGMKVLGLSCVTNKAAGLSGTLLHHEEVLETGRRSRTTFTALLRSILPRLAHDPDH